MTDVEAERRKRLATILWDDPLIRDALRIARDLDLPQWRIVSGAVYNTVWNALSDRPSGYGVKDIDLFFFDPADLSYANEDAAIRRAEAAFDRLGAPVEARNQARAHLWFPERFGQPYSPLPNADAALLRFAATTHAIGVRLEPDDRIDIIAPFGLTDVFERRLRPNRALDNRPTYDRKSTRIRMLWPEVEILPW